MDGPLPQLTTGRPFLTDGGIETDLIFHHGVELPEFAAFVLVREDAGLTLLRDYYRDYLDIAARCGTGFILETPTWRASRHWGGRLGWSAGDVAGANRQAVETLAELRDDYASTVDTMVVSGCVGPRDDGYRPTARMTADEARAYHIEQIGTLAAAGVDMISALTLTYVDEAVGIARAATESGVPAAISFTVETDGRLPSGDGLGDAIEAVDAATGTTPAYFMINCAHPVHVADVLEPGDGWTARVRGLRANASMRSHAELDEAVTLDEGDPDDLGARYARLRARVSGLDVLGGCCGTDARHISAIARAVGLERPRGPVAG